MKGGVQPFWRGDGRELFYLALDMKIMAVSVISGNDFRAGDPAPLFELPYPVEPFYDLRNIHDVTPDGRRFLVNLPTTMPPPPSINVVLNWPEAAHHSRQIRLQAAAGAGARARRTTLALARRA